MKNYYKISEFAALCGLSRDTLLHYDRIGILTVSYTHLDVYKRQGVAGHGAEDHRAQHAEHDEQGGVHIQVHEGQAGPVSYTHLHRRTARGPEKLFCPHCKRPAGKKQAAKAALPCNILWKAV